MKMSEKKKIQHIIYRTVEAACCGDAFLYHGQGNW